MQALAVLLAQDSFFQSWWFFIIMGLLLAGLVGLLLYLRNKQSSE